MSSFSHFPLTLNFSLRSWYLSPSYNNEGSCNCPKAGRCSQIWDGMSTCQAKYEKDGPRWCPDVMGAQQLQKYQQWVSVFSTLKPGLVDELSHGVKQPELRGMFTVGFTAGNSSLEFSYVLWRRERWHDRSLWDQGVQWMWPSLDSILV